MNHETIRSSGPLSHNEPDVPALRGIGWNDEWARLFKAHAPAGAVPGRLVRIDGQSAVALTGAGTCIARLASGRAQHGSVGTAAVGDWVALAPVVNGEATVMAVLPRTSTLARTRNDQLSVADVQAVVANVDVVFIVQAADNINVRRAEREVAIVRDSGARPALVLSKRDLLPDPAAVAKELALALPGVQIHLVSGLTGEGVAEIAAAGAGGRTLALIGASGVGKSTLVNRLLGEDVQHTQPVQADGRRGRHTTSARSLFALPEGGALIDTPGMRSVGLTGSTAAVDAVFSDIAELALRCRFHDCRHGGEPGCAVAAAADAGELPAERLSSYSKLTREAQWVTAKSDPRLATERKRERRLQNRRLRIWEKLEK